MFCLVIVVWILNQFLVTEGFQFFPFCFIYFPMDGICHRKEFVDVQFQSDWSAL